MKTQTLLKDLTKRVEIILSHTQVKLSNASQEALSKAPNQGSWSALQCLAHLNLYGAYYIPALEKALNQQRLTSTTDEFKPGWLGKKFTNMLSAEAGKKMKTMKKLEPAQVSTSSQTLPDFVAMQHKILQLLKQAEKANLNKRAVPLEFMKLINLKIGDVLSFVIAHEERHIAQAMRAIQSKNPDRQTLYSTPPHLVHFISE